jgi:hypothetical protein
MFFIVKYSDFVAELKSNFPSAIVERFYVKFPSGEKHSDWMTENAHLFFVEATMKGDSEYALHYYSCLSCGKMLGLNNPRQLCKKTYCPEN